MSNEIERNVQDIEGNGSAIASIPQIFVPRSEIDAKLETIHVQIQGVRDTQEAIKEQGDRQTAEIIRRIERMDRPGQ